MSPEKLDRKMTTRFTHQCCVNIYIHSHPRGWCVCVLHFTPHPSSIEVPRVVPIGFLPPTSLCTKPTCWCLVGGAIPTEGRRCHPHKPSTRPLSRPFRHTCSLSQETTGKDCRLARRNASLPRPGGPAPTTNANNLLLL